MTNPTNYITRDLPIDKLFKALSREGRVHKMVFDIETRPGNDDAILPFYEEPDFLADPGEWDPRPEKEGGHFKPGNASKKETIEKKLEEQRQAHILARSKWRREVTEWRDKSIVEYKRSCQIHPLRCEIAAIGYGYVVPPLSPEDQVNLSAKQLANRPNFTTTLDIDPENPEEMIRRFQQIYETVSASNGLLISHNGDGFDLPVLQVRSLIHGQPVQYISEYGKSEQFHLDTMALATAYTRNPKHRYLSLDDLGHYLDIPTRKSDEVTGEEWWEAYNDDRRDMAIDYLRKDILSLYECATAMKIL